MSDVKENTNVEIWSTLLKSVANKTERSLPRTTLLILGGSVLGTQEFVDTLRTTCELAIDRGTRKTKPPSRSSDLATCTYIDLQDPDADETIGRIGLYMQPGCAMHKAKALHKYLERQNLEEVIICILLDWHYPWTWLRTLRFWIRSITGIIESLKSSKSNQDFVIENGIKALETRIRAYTESAKMESITALQHDPSLARPLGKGEFDRPIGLPIMCVAQNSDHTHVLARERGMKEEQFDFIQQVLRTALLRHGGSLTYTSLSSPESMHLIKRNILRQMYKQNYDQMSNDEPDLASTVIRDQVFVPTGWDSWVKLGVLREGFDVENISNLWTRDLDHDTAGGDEPPPEADLTAVQLYEEIIADPSKKRLVNDAQDLEVVAIDRMKILQEIEQHQWEVQEANEETEEIVESNPEQFDRPRSRPLQSSSTTRSTTLQGSSSTGQNSAKKDEYVQAFFQNLLSRRESERAVER